MRAAEQRRFKIRPRQSGDADREEKSDRSNGEVQAKIGAKLGVQDETENHPENTPVNQVEAVTDFSQFAHGFRRKKSSDPGFRAVEKTDEQAETGEFDGGTSESDAEEQAVAEVRIGQPPQNNRGPGTSNLDRDGIRLTAA